MLVRIRVASLALCAALAVSLLWPSIPIESEIPGLDKVAHVLIFFAMSAGLRGVFPRVPLWRIAAGAWLVAAATEAAQHWTGRDPDLLDLAANTVGIGLFMLVEPLARRLRRR